MTERMYEVFHLIKAAWIHHDGPFSFEGRFHHHRMVNIWPRPWQQPHPLIWISSTSPEGAIRVGEGGYTIGCFHTGFDGARGVFNYDRKGWTKAGRPGPAPEDRLGYSALISSFSLRLMFGWAASPPMERARFSGSQSARRPS